MFNYMIVLRIIPFPPNWVANLGAPHLDVPVGAFFWGTFIGMFDRISLINLALKISLFLGVAGPSFIHVQAGAAIDRLSSSDQLQIFTPLNVLCLVAVAIVALVPVAVRRRYKL
jgi:uncharacterized membrane protein YdjX (TVP38/TMEM64 family)